MPDIYLGAEQRLGAHTGDNLLDILLRSGQPVPWSCRSGHCHSCLVQARPEEVPSQANSGLDPEQQRHGWLLACQCVIRGDMHIHLHDPATDGLRARISHIDQITDEVLLLRLLPDKPLRFQPGQHIVVWLDGTLARPYSIASLPADGYLEFHLALHTKGAFSQAIRRFQVGDTVYLGAASGHFHYDQAWQDTPLLLLASGTGLAPLQAIAREALTSGHEAPISLWHWSHAASGCYLQERLQALADEYPSLTLHLRPRAELTADLTQLRLASRQTLALLCGQPDFVEQLRKPLFMAGLPGRQILDEAFISRQ